MVKQTSTTRQRERAKLFADMGQRIRWIREAYERREPLMHSQASWAQALGITPEMYNRIELGRSTPVDVLFRIIYRSGASLDYLVWAVLDPAAFEHEWLYRALLAEHRNDLEIDPARWRKTRSMRLNQITVGHARTPSRARRAYVRRKKSENDDPA